MGGIWRRNAALVATVTVLIAACGGDDDDAGSAESAPDATEAATTEPRATDPPATDPPATDPPSTEPPATDPPATDPPATDPPAEPDTLAYGQASLRYRLSSPDDGFAVAWSNGNQVAIQYRIRGRILIVQLPPAIDGFAPAVAEPTVGLLELPPPPDTCADPEGTGCGYFTPGFDPVDKCLLVHAASGSLDCYDVTDPSSPTSAWSASINLCPDGMNEKGDFEEQCDAGETAAVGDFRVMATRGGGNLVVIGEDDTEQCRIGPGPSQVAWSPAAPDESGTVVTINVSRQNISDGADEHAEIDLATCEPVGDAPPTPFGSVNATAGDGVWSLSPTDDGSYVASGPAGRSADVGTPPPWFRPALLPSGDRVFATTMTDAQQAGVVMVQAGVAEPVTGLPTDFTAATVAGDGGLVVVRGATIEVYDVG